MPKLCDLRETIRSWLEVKEDEGFLITEDVSPQTKLTKAQLMTIVNRLTCDEFGEADVPKTKVEQLVKQYGHRIQKPPPYNPDLDPIVY